MGTVWRVAGKMHGMEWCTTYMRKRERKQCTEKKHIKEEKRKHLASLLKECFIDILSFNIWTSLVAQTVKHLSTTWETQVQSLGWKDPLEKEMVTHSSTLAWKIPQMEERVGYSPWGRKESVMTEWLHFLFFFFKLQHMQLVHIIPGQVWSLITCAGLTGSWGGQTLGQTILMMMMMSVRVFVDETDIWVGRLSEADCLQPCGLFQSAEGLDRTKDDLLHERKILLPACLWAEAPGFFFFFFSLLCSDSYWRVFLGFPAHFQTGTTPSVLLSF